MVTFVVKKKSVFFSQAAFQLFKFIQILFANCTSVKLKFKEREEVASVKVPEAVHNCSSVFVWLVGWLFSKGPGP